MRQADTLSLIEAKLHAAKPRAGDTARELVKDLCTKHSDQSLCIVGPAGSGKSTVMRQLLSHLEENKIRCSWLSLDARDNAPATFVAYLTAAVRKLSDAGTSALLPPYDTADPQALDRALHALQLLVAKMPDGRVLFLDDMHHLTEPSLLEGLNYFLDSCAGSLRVIIGSRTVPDLQIQRRVIEGQFKQVTQSELNFTQAEAIDFFSDLSEVDLDADEVRAIHKATEGWAAGLQFASIYLRNSPHQKANLISKMTGRDADLSHYLASNAFSIQPADLQAFLLDTAPLHNFSPELCESVCDSENPVELLERARTSNLFLNRLDLPGDWYRYHQLFADFLLARLNQFHPGKSVTIKRRAAAWCIENDMPEDAIRYFLDCEDYDKAAELISQIGLEVSRDNGSLSTILRWVEALPEEYRTSHPQMIVDHSLALVFTRGPNEGRALLQSMYDGLAEDPPRWRLDQEDQTNLICYAEAVELVSFAVEEKIDLTIEKSDKWMAKWADAADVNHAIAHCSRSYCLMLANQFDRARKSNAIAQARSLKSDSAHVSIWADCIETMILSAEGNLDAAEICAARAIKRAHSELGNQSQLDPMTYLLKSFLDYERGDRKAAYEALLVGQEFADTYGPVEPLLITFRLRAQMLREQGEMDKALETLDLGARIGLSHSLHRLAITLIADQVTFLIEMGQVEKATALSEKWGVGTGANSNIVATETLLQSTMAKRISLELAIAKGEAEQAIKMCQPMTHDLRRNGRYRTLIRVGILRAVALSMDGQTKKSWREMSAVLAEARERNFVASFFELRHLCVPIIEEIVAFRETELESSKSGLDTPEDWILKALKGEAGGAQSAGSEVPTRTDPDVDALTGRETAMLRLAHKGYSNAEIATSLLISVATVKWHLHNAFQKLDVKNRSAAVARAGELGIL